ncbi:hypothetical protein JCGZ_13545 [Jatropha curcas]|uniref:Uncharacterized protein n=1 Tax=Jatropha curcas TaxID=180498 RepID=A0A067KA36_JATCU|nr:hypothetical protein JCGZ_13545 [Jatropha curcas]
MMARLLQTINIFMDKVTGKKIDVLDSHVNQSPTSKSSTKEENEYSSKCVKELRGQPPRSPSGGTDSGRDLTEERPTVTPNIVFRTTSPMTHPSVYEAEDSHAP